MDVFVNRSDARGNTALHMAVMHKKMASITYLLANGARASLRALNEHHLTPITLAVRKGDTDMFQHLVSQVIDCFFVNAMYCHFVVPLADRIGVGGVRDPARNNGLGIRERTNGGAAAGAD